VEERPLAKENTDSLTRAGQQNRENLGQNKLGGVREVAKKDGKCGSQPCCIMLTVDLLRDSYGSLKERGSPGVTGMTWREYGERPGGPIEGSA